MTDRDFSKKDGQWFPVMNELAEKLITYELTKIEHRVMWMFFRFCYGYQNATCDLRWTDMRDITQLPESSLAKALKGLKERNILHTTQTEGKSYIKYKINSKLSTWKLPGEKTPQKPNLEAEERLRTITDVQGFLHKRGVEAPHSEPIPIKDKRKRQVSGKAASDDKKAEQLRLAIWELASELVKRKIFAEAKAFVGKMLKHGKNEKAVYHTLQQCYKKQVFEGGNAWGYAAKIMQIENGNFNEREHAEEVDRQQQALAEMDLGALTKNIGNIQ